ncbi:MAG: CAP domain-containing protein [Gaiellaceae bacterium]
MGKTFLTLCALAAVALVVAVPVGGASSAGEPRRGKAASLETQVLSGLNALRAGRGLRPLRFSTQLAAAAEAHSRDMVRRGYFDHTSKDGTPFSKRVARFYRPGSSEMWSAGENLLWYSPDIDAATAISMWMKSPGHRAILLSPQWREVGLSAVHVRSAPGVFKGLEVTVVTADFGVRR